MVPVLAAPGGSRGGPGGSKKGGFPGGPGDPPKRADFGPKKGGFSGPGKTGPGGPENAENPEFWEKIGNSKNGVFWAYFWCEIRPKPGKNLSRLGELLNTLENVPPRAPRTPILGPPGPPKKGVLGGPQNPGFPGAPRGGLPALRAGRIPTLFFPGRAGAPSVCD